MNKDYLIKILVNLGVVKQGTFLLKSHELSKVYVDLRELVAFPSDSLQGRPNDG